eukprot:scaffold41415_cov264-Isochrysis_galbana.AAC.3
MDGIIASVLMGGSVRRAGGAREAGQVANNVQREQGPDERITGNSGAAGRSARHFVAAFNGRARWQLGSEAGSLHVLDGAGGHPGTCSRAHSRRAGLREDVSGQLEMRSHKKQVRLGDHLR